MKSPCPAFSIRGSIAVGNKRIKGEYRLDLTMDSQQSFGGRWTEEKLGLLTKTQFYNGTAKVPL